jgi:hypothetical protein
LIPKLPPWGLPEPTAAVFFSSLSRVLWPNRKWFDGVEGKTILDVNGWAAAGLLGFSNWKMM